MRFGFFDQLPLANWQSESQRYQDILAQIELGDALGFDTAWLGELHFIPSISCLASPLMILAAAAQRTKRIRLGTAVTLLPLHNPVKMAEDAATLDVLSGGRLEFGVGRGAAPVYFAGYNVPHKESRERFEEALEVILQAWTSERLSYEGKYWQVQNLLLTPKPVQKPYPPVRIAANSPETFAIAGRDGFPIFASPLINPPDKLREYLAVHRESLKPGVKQNVALAFPVHVAESRAQARRECEVSLLSFFKAASELIKPSGGAPTKGSDSQQKLRARITEATFESIDREMGVFGDPDYCVERIQALRQEFPMEEFICYFNRGGLIDHATVRRSMELFAKEVMPQCR
ncbi:MAG: LLM class flavin-dependent oxidoreductase [Deltaproteobacteria bacterium]|nr:LLM class flavin-dependent oxidoreductase [Deltaproteobacteria bacterium]